MLYICCRAQQAGGTIAGKITVKRNYRYDHKKDFYCNLNKQRAKRVTEARG